MPFIREYGTILKRADGIICSIDYNNGIFINCDDEKNIYNEKIIDGDLSFVDVWFDIDDKDKIYGVINDTKGSIFYLECKNNIISKTNFYNYDKNNTLIKFPYIKNINDNKHIIYYSMDSYNGNFFKLIHYKKSNDKVVKREIDRLGCFILSNFCVEFNEDMMYVFYFKIVDELEEVFVCFYNINEDKWESPIQLTSTNKQKVYLSLVRDNNNNFYINYAENNDNKYYCMCLKVNILKDKVIDKNIKVINKCIECTFPQIIMKNNRLYVQWVEYGKLMECFSDDFGESFSMAKIFSKSIDNDFVRYNYSSNNKDDKDLSLITIFIEKV